MNSLIHFPAHLLTGNPSYIEEQLLSTLHSIFLKNHPYDECSACISIKEKKFYGFSWITPENRYTLDALTPIFQKITFQLPESEHHFFIIMQADLLTTACANTLLKLVEEPPTGYHFIFVAPHKNLVLPTIVSRCIENHYSKILDNTLIALHPLVTQAISANHDFTTIYKEVATYSLNEHETLQLFETITSKFIDLYKKNFRDESSLSSHILFQLIEYCKNSIKKPVQPGSAKILWKDFFMYKTLLLQEE